MGARSLRGLSGEGDEPGMRATIGSRIRRLEAAMKTARVTLPIDKQTIRARLQRLPLDVRERLMERLRIDERDRAEWMKDPVVEADTRGVTIKIDEERLARLPADVRERLLARVRDENGTGS